MPKVCVLAVDALEYDLVVGWELKGLMQRRFGCFKVDPELYYEDVGEPYTPMVWATFITGKPPSEHGIRTWWKQYRLARLAYRPPFCWLKRFRLVQRIARKMGVRVAGKEDLRVPSLFDLIEPSIAIHVPGYNYPTWARYKLAEALSSSIEEYARVAWGLYELEKRELINTLKRSTNWKLVMAWFGIADYLGHVYFRSNPSIIRQVYEDLNGFAQQVSKLIPENTVLLIVSDHGMEADPEGEGRHSDHAFWSLNIDTEWQPKRFTDFFPKILEWIRGS